MTLKFPGWFSRSILCGRQGAVLVLATLIIAGCSDEADNTYVSGLKTLQSNDAEREYYIQFPSDFDPDVEVAPLSVADPRKPLLIAFHGTGGSYERWVGEGAYDLADEVGDDAIMIFPSAREQADGIPNWNYSYDFMFFEDILARLDELNIPYDPARVFITGHSTGGGIAHEIGCRYGDLVRGIAPSAGALLSTACVGGVAVLMAQGENDVLVNINIAGASRNFWAAYNALDSEQSIAGAVSPCVDHSLSAPGGYDYPVVWCQHSEGTLDDFSGHAWASFTSEAVWQFFSTLSDVEPGFDEPPGGGNEAVAVEADTTITFTLKYPDELETPLTGAITMYEAGFADCPGFAIPAVFLNVNWLPVGGLPGATVTYENVPIVFRDFFGPIPDEDVAQEWTLQFSVYVEGGGSLVPVAGLDVKVLKPIDIEGRNVPIVIEEVLELEVFDGIYYKLEGDVCVVDEF